ncbi:MAG TPA: DUF5698 domain-containing protein [Terriglobales bacterium]|nr:DUF5698 domain-containing protein [Terriglobales bacterium]
MDMALLLLCIKIFCCRIIDVSLSTVRMILSVKGKTLWATIIGFFEVLVWFLIVREALNSSNGGLTLAVFYAGGFATGTFVGGKLAQRLIIGHITIQIITSRRDDAMLAAIREAGYAISVINVNSSEFGSEKYLLIAEMKSSQQGKFKDLVRELDPTAFVMVNETKYVVGGFGVGKKK